VYPVELPADSLVGKHVLEGIGRRAGGPVPSQPNPSRKGGTAAGRNGGSPAADGVHEDGRSGEPAGPAITHAESPGAADALRRP
jgi:amidophosphoribosyltransferase